MYYDAYLGTVCVKGLNAVCVRVDLLDGKEALCYKEGVVPMKSLTTYALLEAARVVKAAGGTFLFVNVTEDVEVDWEALSDVISVSIFYTYPDNKDIIECKKIAKEKAEERLKIA